MNKQPILIFDEVVENEDCIDWYLVNCLAEMLSKDDEIVDVTEYLKIPNATEEKIRKLHAAHVERRSRHNNT